MKPPRILPQAVLRGGRWRLPKLWKNPQLEAEVQGTEDAEAQLNAWLEAEIARRAAGGAVPKLAQGRTPVRARPRPCHAQLDGVVYERLAARARELGVTFTEALNRACYAYLELSRELPPNRVKGPLPPPPPKPRSFADVPDQRWDQAAQAWVLTAPK